MMSEISDREDQDRMSVRHSLLVWVSGAVLGWVVAVVAIYGLLRDTDEPRIADKPTPAASERAIADENPAPRELNKIAPASGDLGAGDLGAGD